MLRSRFWAALFLFLVPFLMPAQDGSSFGWQGTVTTEAGKAIVGASVQLRGANNNTNTTDTGPGGSFHFEGLLPGRFSLSVEWKGRRAVYPQPVDLPSAASSVNLKISERNELSMVSSRTGGEQLSSKAVSSIPLNKRDFSALLLLAAGTMTDTNGATNFTQQFAINGQRGVEAVFAMDGADTSDPEMGGATFSNFNVDAVQEIQSVSGLMPAEIGRGGAGFTNMVTRSGAAGFHGSVFEFIRNSAFDARNFFDRRSIANPGRIPPFRRNEFGFTNGGPVIIPGLYDGRGKTFYFTEYQGFRQVLGTTQVFPVPTSSERQGLDRSAYPGDVLLIQVDPRIAKLLNRYPLPNDLGGPYGARTYATSSKVSTDADQFSIRIDHKLSEKAQLFGRFTLDNLSGPTTNPDQTAIDPSFGIRYMDRQRNGAITYTRAVSARFTFEFSVSVTRTTPAFPTGDHTDPALTFNDGLYEPFNAAAGSVMTAFGNLFQARQNFTLVLNKHTLKWGGEFRANRDSTYFGTAPNGSYTFGGGTAYAPVNIRSLSGTHDISASAPLPDTLSALLSANPFAYTVAVAPQIFPQGDQIGVAAISRYNANFFFQDTWRISNRLVLDYGLRYEIYTPISERAKRTSGLIDVNAPSGLRQEYVVNPQPGYKLDLAGFGPRVKLAWRPRRNLEITVGGTITTIPPNIWQDNFLTGGAPFTIYPRLTAAPGSPIAFGVPITPGELPTIQTPSGANIFASGNSKAVPANTVWDVNRFEQGIAALSPNHQITPLNTSTIWPGFRNASLSTWSLGLERHFGGLDASAAYVGTAGARLPATDFPNGYPGADPAFAPYTQFNASGAVTGGFGTETLLTDRSHSTYHSLQTSVQGNIGRDGPGVQASYTWSKSLDDTSAVLGGFISGASGALSPAAPQNPFDTNAEKGPSTFDVTHAFTASVIQDLHADRVRFLRPLSRKITAGWQLLSISTITSGLPFTVYSGVQQTGVGSNGVDRPDQAGLPDLSTSRKIREDYFGLGSDNASYFSIPIGLADGTGPNSGRFGTFGRNTLRGPAFYNFDFGLIKDTPFGTRGNGELVNLQIRAEFFNLFNIVNFGLPANIIKGSGFGEISRTAGNSRQIQFSLKLIF
ncbi:MAG: TonB-dependent receptor [Acidobacteriota bacterium]|nr:TonB-dependent receptor [Acidobacteriota bacterium]